MENTTLNPTHYEQNFGSFFKANGIKVEALGEQFKAEVPSLLSGDEEFVLKQTLYKAFPMFKHEVNDVKNRNVKRGSMPARKARHIAEGNAIKKTEMVLDLLAETDVALSAIHAENKLVDNMAANGMAKSSMLNPFTTSRKRRNAKMREFAAEEAAEIAAEKADAKKARVAARKAAFEKAAAEASDDEVDDDL